MTLGLRSASEDPAEGVAKRLALRHLWNRRRMAMVNPYTGTPIYEILNADRAPASLLPRLAEIHIRAWLRFGNAILQLRNALLAAERYRAVTLRLPPHPFLTGDRAGRLNIEWSEESSNEALTLSGLFLARGPLRLYGPLHNEPRLIVRYIRPMLSPDIAAADPRVGPDDLILHFRAGDVFKYPCNSGGYGQPPLAYYLGAVEREEASRVWLVAEDRTNPCVDAVETSLRAKGVDVVYQSATLAEDLRVMLSARRLVIGRGTFASTVASLSSNLQRAYVFDTSPTLKRLGIHVVRGRDLRGDFDRAILRSNWRASPEQLGMLLTYPRKALGFVDMPTTWWRRHLWDSA